MTTTNAQALILFAHGARDARWAEPFQDIATRMRARHPTWQVELAYLELMQPDLRTAVASIVANKHEAVTIAPLFLARGGHLREDFPKLLASVAAEYPNLKINTTDALGDSPQMRESIANWLDANTTEQSAVW
jgi:sirohydrochlorin cobaltochelatase